jgi:hypothetical protein
MSYEQAPRALPGSYRLLAAFRRGDPRRPRPADPVSGIVILHGYLWMLWDKE